MPELPEVETMRRGVLGCVGARIRDVVQPQSGYRPLAMSPTWSRMRRQLIHRSIAAVRRLGKRVLMDLDNEQSLVFQPKMSGLLMVGEPPTVQHVRMRLYFDGGQHSEVLYWDSRGLGSIHLWDPEEVDRFLGANVLGPDAVEVDLQTFRSRFEECKRAIKPTLLDQKRLAGVGNLYASEILHRAKVHPESRCCDLSRAQWKKIYDCMRTVLLAAIEAEGSTLGDGTYRKSKSDPGSYQNHHLVYDRADEICPTCRKSTILRIVQTQRSTFYCERCQAISIV